MAQHQSENTVLAQMERIGELDAELDDLRISTTSSEAIFDRLEEHARLRLEIALECVSELPPELRPIPTDPDPAYFDRLNDYFKSLHAHERPVPGGQIAAESIANDGVDAAWQLRCTIKGRRLLAEGNTEAVARLMFVCMRALRSYDGRLMSTCERVTASLLVRRRSNDWDAKGNRRERRLHELLAEGCTVTEAGQKIVKEERRPRRLAELRAQGGTAPYAERIIAREEKSEAVRDEIQKKGPNVIRSLRERFKRRGEPFPSPTRQATESIN